MVNYFENLPYFLLVALAVWAGKSIVSSLAYRRQLRTLGCQAPPKAFQWDPVFGSDWDRAEARANLTADRLKFLQGEFAKYGKTFQHSSWGVTTLDTMDPENYQVIATTMDEYIRGNLNSIVMPLTGHGLFTADGDEWKYHRNLIKPVFARSQVSDLKAFEGHANRFFALIPRDGSTFDLQPLLKRLFLDTSTEFLFGESFNSLSPEASAEGDIFTKTMDRVLKVMTSLRTNPIARFKKMDPEIARDIETIHSIPNKNIDRVLSSLKASPSEKASQKHFVLLDELVKETQDRDALRSTTLNLFIGARDAPAVTTANVMFLLARHPDVWAKLRKEVLAVGDRPLTFELLKSMTYMRHVLNETLRLYSPARLITRLCGKDSVLPTGGGPDGKLPILVKKGTVVRGYFGATHRDPEIWGNDADDFKPERWEDLRPGWSYTPFSGGPRICPAQQMVLIEVSWLVARFMQQFESVENRDPVHEWLGMTYAIIQSKNGCKVALTPVQDSKAG